MKKASFKKSLSVVIKQVKKKNLSFKFPFKNISLNAYLVFTVIIFAFILGMLTVKVLDLQQQVNEAKAGTNAVNTAAAGTTAPSTRPVGPVKVATGDYPLIGQDSAKVTVIEFADFRCPYCEQWFQNIEPNLIKDYVDTGKVKLAFRNYAFLGPASTLAANAGECANEQGKFWEFHNYMYQNQPPETDTSMYTVDNLSQIAGTLGMDQGQFRSCLSSNKYDKNVAKDLADGQAAGVNGTPTTFINGVAVVGAIPYDQLKQQIDQELR